MEIIRKTSPLTFMIWTMNIPLQTYDIKISKMLKFRKKMNRSNFFLGRTGSGHVDKIMLGQVFSKNFSFPCQSSFH
jgi:hypothetical protein